MKRLIAALLATVALTACGADGYPTTPQKSPISISGETRIGVVAGGPNPGFYNGTDLNVTVGF